MNAQVEEGNPSASLKPICVDTHGHQGAIWIWGRRDEEHKAIAKLVAEAPEVLAALKACVTVLSPSAIVMDAHKEMVYNDAVATIKRATS